MPDDTTFTDIKLAMAMSIARTNSRELSFRDEPGTSPKSTDIAETEKDPSAATSQESQSEFPEATLSEQGDYIRKGSDCIGYEPGSITLESTLDIKSPNDTLDDFDLVDLRNLKKPVENRTSLRVLLGCCLISGM